MMGRSNEREGAALPRGDYSPGMSKPNTERPGPPFIQSVLEVRRKEQLTPHLMRVVLTGEDIPHFEETTVGVNNKSLPASARASVVLEAFGPEDELPLTSRAKAEIRWLHNPDPARGSKLPEAVRALALPAQGGRRFAYVAAELRAVRALRQYFRVEKGWRRDELYAYSYWKADAPEHVSEPERRRERDSL